MMAERSVGGSLVLLVWFSGLKSLSTSAWPGRSLLSGASLPVNRVFDSHRNV